MCDSKTCSIAVSVSKSWSVFLSSCKKVATQHFLQNCNFFPCFSKSQPSLQPLSEPKRSLTHNERSSFWILVPVSRRIRKTTSKSVVEIEGEGLLDSASAPTKPQFGLLISCICTEGDETGFLICDWFVRGQLIWTVSLCDENLRPSAQRTEPLGTLGVNFLWPSKVAHIWNNDLHRATFEWLCVVDSPREAVSTMQQLCANNPTTGLLTSVLNHALFRAGQKERKFWRKAALTSHPELWQGLFKDAVRATCERLFSCRRKVVHMNGTEMNNPWLEACCTQAAIPIVFFVRWALWGRCNSCGVGIVGVKILRDTRWQDSHTIQKMVPVKSHDFSRPLVKKWVVWLNRNHFCRSTVRTHFYHDASAHDRFCDCRVVESAFKRSHRRVLSSVSIRHFRSV